jgi:putative glycosyltransferase (TIGR04372 family)
MSMDKNKNNLRWFFEIVLPKVPIFVLALPFVFLMRLLRPLIWIRLIPVFERIGHGTANTDCYLLDRMAGLDPSKAVDIFYPDRPWKCNRQMIRIWKRLVPLYDFAYWIAWANKEIPGFQAHHYDRPHGDRDFHGLSDDAPPLMFFTIKEMDRGQALLRAMGIPAESPFVCFNSSDNSFLKTAVPGQDWGYHDYRDSDIDSYVLAIKELVARGYYCIRMGKTVHKPFAWKDAHVIDYAMSPWRSDFADLYLISRCHLNIGDTNGLNSVAWAFRKPWVSLNMIPVIAAPDWSRIHTIIFKKVRAMRENRLLNFKEMIAWDSRQYAFSEGYRKSGFEIIDNSPEEIRDAVIEMEERVRGCWQTNEEYEQLQQKFCLLWQVDPRNRVFRSRVGSKFLFSHQELL